MTTKIKTTLLTAFFFFGLLSGLQAQDKYEFAVVKYTGNRTYSYSVKPGIYVSISGKGFEKIEIEKDQLKDQFSDYTLVLNYVQNMTDNGWKVISTNTHDEYLMFVLEKKKN